MRTTKNISITLPPSLLKQASKVARTEGRTQSELFREALRRYIVQAEFQRLRSYGVVHTKQLGLKPSDIPRLIKEYRRE
jgi:metal-responsive CopG/Arc/MetJ family transcriptional regulator